MTDQERTQKLLTCKQCIHSHCAGNFVNKCDEQSLECLIKEENIYKMLDSNLNCPKGFWNGIVLSSGGGCGCG